MSLDLRLRHLLWLPAARLDALDQIGAVEGPAVGDGGKHLRRLQGRHHQKALPHGEIDRIAHRPGFQVGIEFPLWGGHQSRDFGNLQQPGALPQTEGGAVGGEQGGILAIQGDADIIKDHIAGCHQAVIERDRAVPGFEPASFAVGDP